MLDGLCGWSAETFRRTVIRCPRSFTVYKRIEELVFIF
jgi:hypothetical protein